MLTRWHLHRATYPQWALPEATHRRLVRLWTAVALFWVVLGVVGMARAARFIGEPFPGFVWVEDAPVPFAPVNRITRLAETPWWGGAGEAIPTQAKIVAIDGQPIQTTPDFGDYAPGTPVAYTVRLPNGQESEVVLPVRRFVGGHYFEFYGLLFLAGLTNTAVGLVVLRRAADKPTALLAVALVVLGGMGLQHSAAGCVSTCTLADQLFSRFVGFVAYTPTMLLTGIVLVHFSLIYPNPLLPPRHTAWIVRGMYAVAAFALVFFHVNDIVIHKAWVTWQFRSMLLWIAFGSAFLLVRAVHAALLAHTQETLMLGWALAGGVLLTLFSGVILFLGPVPNWLLTSLVYPADIIYPLVVLYALRNMALVSRLEEELERSQHLERQVRELQHLHERALRNVAAMLHDAVLADLKGIQFLARATAGNLSQYDWPVLDELRKLDRYLQEVANRLRGVMDGVRPVDFEQEGLVRPLERLFEAMNSLYGGTWQAHLQEADLLYDTLPPAVQEHLYWIVRGALVNSRDHAQATRFEARLTCVPEGEVLHGTVWLHDDGRGFDVEAVLERAAQAGAFGLQNMRWRVEEELGGELRIESQPGEGTTIWVKFTWNPTNAVDVAVNR